MIWHLPSRQRNGSRHESIAWGSELTGNAQPDVDDGGRLDDYDPASRLDGPTDSSGANYCHDLVEGDEQDWRTPTSGELRALALHGPLPFGFSSDVQVFSSTSQRVRVLTVNLASGQVDDLYTYDKAHAICVRQATAP